jgi:hypothetical protein
MIVLARLAPEFTRRSLHSVHEVLFIRQSQPNAKLPRELRSDAVLLDELAGPPGSGPTSSMGPRCAALAMLNML